MMEGYHRALVWERRFVVSGPIIITTAIGTFSATSSITASIYVAKRETVRITNEQNVLRAIESETAIKNNLINNKITVGLAKSVDTIRYIIGLSTKTSNGLQDAVQLHYKLNFLFNEDKIISFNDPGSELWYSTIEHIVDKNAKGITTTEIKEATRLTASVSTLTTTMIPLKNFSNKCTDALITMMVPVINFNSRTVFEVRNGQLQKKYINESTYTLLSKDSVIIKSSTRLFGISITNKQLLNESTYTLLSKDSVIIKSSTRLFGTSITIKSSSMPTGNLLYERYNFIFKGEIVLTET